MSTSTLALSIVIIFLLFAILVGYAVIKLTYRNHHYPPSYYHPMGAPSTFTEQKSGSGTLLTMIFLILLTIALVFATINGNKNPVGDEQGAELEYVRFGAAKSHINDLDRGPTIPPAYDRTSKSAYSDKYPNTFETRRRVLPPPPKTVRIIEPQKTAPEIKPTFAYSFTCSNNFKWAKSAAEKLAKNYPGATVVDTKEGDYPYKVIIYSSTLEADVESWHKRHTEIRKGWIIDLP